MTEEKIKVLLCDDETDFTEPMSFWFESKGYTTFIASNGPDCIQLVKDRTPDILFMDLNMPGMDGIETFKKIREFDTELPVIIISAYADPQKIAEVRSLGASGVFYKNEDFDKGLSLLEATLRTHKRLKRD